jgi:hypothetical protein
MVTRLRNSRLSNGIRLTTEAEIIFTAQRMVFGRWNFQTVRLEQRGRDSSVGIATGYGLDGPGIESRWGRDFSHTSRPALGPTQPPVQWVPGLSRGQSGRGVVLTTHRFLAPRSRKNRSIPLPPSGLSSLLRGSFTFYAWSKSLMQHHVWSSPSLRRREYR